jgi:hypothetical protein
LIIELAEIIKSDRFCSISSKYLNNRHGRT